MKWRVLVNIERYLFENLGGQFAFASPTANSGSGSRCPCCAFIYSHGLLRCTKRNSPPLYQSSNNGSLPPASRPWHRSLRSGRFLLEVGRSVGRAGRTRVTHYRTLASCSTLTFPDTIIVRLTTVYDGAPGTVTRLFAVSWAALELGNPPLLPNTLSPTDREKKKILKLRLHDTTGCQTGCQTGLTTGCIV